MRESELTIALAGLNVIQTIALAALAVIQYRDKRTVEPSPPVIEPPGGEDLPRA